MPGSKRKRAGSDHEQEPAAKKARCDLQDHEFMEGSIVSITLHNFMTYTHAVVRPGPRLNIVLGPNGSGKSSIVAAICLVLNGKASLLGRATEVGDYVRQGEREGWIEIELYCLPRNVKVKRTIKLMPSELRPKATQDTWHLDGRIVGKDIALKSYERFGIQVDNLCQFLPQEKVHELSKLDAAKLLKETLKSLDPQLVAQQKELSELYKISAEGQRDGKQNEENMESHKKANEKLREKVERFKEREKLQRDLDLMTKKRPWVEYDQTVIAAKKAKQELQERKDEVKKHQPALKKAHKKMEEMKAVVAALTRTKYDCREEGKELVERMQEMTCTLGKKEEHMNDCKNQIKELKQKMLAQQRNKKSKEAELASKEAQYSKIDVDSIQRQIAKNRETLRSLRPDALAREKANLINRRTKARGSLANLEKKLERLQSVKKKRVTALQGPMPDVWEAYQWTEVEKREGRMRGEVYGPIFAELDFPQGIDCEKWVEKHVANKVFRGFVFTDAGDRDRFITAVTKRRLKGVAAFLDNGKPLASFRRTPVEQLKPLGAKGYLSDYIIAPDPVMRMLYTLARVNTALIVEEEAIANMETLERQFHIRVVYTDRECVHATRSKYGAKVLSISADQIRPARLLGKLPSEAEDAAELMHDIEKKKLELQEITDEFATLTTKLEEVTRLDKERQQLKKKKRVVKKLEDAIETLKQDIEDLCGDVQQERARLEAEIATSIQAMYTLSLVRADLSTSIVNVKCQDMMLQLQLEAAQQAKHAASMELSEAEASIRGHKMALNKATNLYEDCKRLVKKYKTVAENSAALTDELKDAFADYSDDLDELDDEIANRTAQIRTMMQDGDPAVLVEYKKNENEIKRLEKQIALDKQREAERTTTLTRLTAEWVPKVKQLVKDLDDSFRRYFQALGNVGELELVEHDDFDQYALNMSVSFRKGSKLARLNYRTQSGGEKSVSTMLFLSALQSMTQCPFRLVDEINQGMDKVNERNTFDLVRKIATKPGPQYFLITPKILPNLDYGGNCTVLCVFNGTTLSPAMDKKFSMKRMLRAVKASA